MPQTIYDFIFENPLKLLIAREAQDNQGRTYMIRDVFFHAGYATIERAWKQEGKIPYRGSDAINVGLEEILKDKLLREKIQAKKLSTKQSQVLLPAISNAPIIV